MRRAGDAQPEDMLPFLYRAKRKGARMSDSDAEVWRGRAKGCGCLLILFVLLPLLMLNACPMTDGHPSDRAMIEEFQRDRAGFDALLAMVKEERKVTRIASDFIWADGISSVSEADRRRLLPDNRYARYRALFRRLDLESGVLRYDDGTIAFSRSSTGIVTSGSGKSFIWSADPVPSALDDADQRTLEEACEPQFECRTVRRMAPHWYIAFERD